MKKMAIVFAILVLISCSYEKDNTEMKIIFLHHSTGRTVWLGNTRYKIHKITKKGDVQKYFSKYNKKNKTNYKISEREFPKREPYGWKNYPYDYYNIWVKNGGNEKYLDEPTLEILTSTYDVIIFKHCYPVSNILEDTGNPNINSDEKRLENYKLQYDALKKKMHEFPDTKFIVWTPTALVKESTNESQANRTQEFYKWLINEWNNVDDNIFLWDFYHLETEGGLYLKEEHASGPGDSHPNRQFASSVSPLFSKFIIDCIERE